MKKKIILYVTVHLVFLFVIYNIFVYSLPFNPISSSRDKSIISATFFPEAWGFFTKSPHEPLFDAYNVKKDGSLDKLSMPNGDYYMGASRKGRAIGVEMSLFLQQNEKKLNWIEGYSLADYSAHHTDSMSASVKYPMFKKGDKYIIAFEDRLSWLLASKPLNTKNKLRYAYVYIK